MAAANPLVSQGFTPAGGGAAAPIPVADVGEPCAGGGTGCHSNSRFSDSNRNIPIPLLNQEPTTIDLTKPVDLHDVMDYLRQHGAVLYNDIRGISTQNIAIRYLQISMHHDHITKPQRQDLWQLMDQYTKTALSMLTKVL